jgi:copper resistance protein B
MKPSRNDGRAWLAIAAVVASCATTQAVAQEHDAMPMPQASPTGQLDAAKPTVDHAHSPVVAGKSHRHAGSAPGVGMHDMEQMHGMDDMPPHAMPSSPPRPVTPVPALTDADRAAARPVHGGHPAHDDDIHAYTVFDRLEVSNAGSASVHWQGSTWIGTDLDRLWLRSEGERSGGVLHDADIELLYGRSVATWWSVVVGARHDFKPGAAQDFAAIGLIGTAPYKIEVQATAYVGQGGQASARLEAEYETLLTNRLVLQPLVEVNLFGRDDARRGIGPGVSTAEAGLRLRYEVTRQFAPYVGLVRERAFGRTAAFRRAQGDDIGDTRLVAGVRVWF